MSYASDALIDALKRENNQLQAENAKLRDERDRMYKANVEKNGEILRLLEENAKLRERLKASDDGRKRQADNLIDKYHKIARLQAENAKLRELVESYGMIANEAVCDYYDRDDMLADANATASELGIEVGV